MSHLIRIRKKLAFGFKKIRMQVGRHLIQFSLGNKPWWASNMGAQVEKTEKDIVSAGNRLESP